MPVPDRKPAFSRPVFEQRFVVASEHAQRLLERGFHLVVRALYGIEAVLPIIGEEAETAEVEALVTRLIATCAGELGAEQARLEKLCEDHGVAERPRYTHPEEVRVRVSSPQVAQLTALVRALDALMIVMDALWLTGVLTNQQRADGAYAWRRRVLRLGREIIAIERRAQAAARARGVGLPEGDLPGADTDDRPHEPPQSDSEESHDLMLDERTDRTGRVDGTPPEQADHGDGTSAPEVTT
jgi:hypothetical protein